MYEVNVPELHKCQICKWRDALYDAKTKSGRWGFLCEYCFQEHGIGLGLGKGQKLIIEEENNE